MRHAEAWLTRGLARGQLHEVYAHDRGDAAAASGFAIAVSLAAGATPLLWLRTDDAERHEGRLHAAGLAELGLAPDALLVVVAADEAALLRAAGDAARCAGVGTVLIETRGAARGLDLTATRRLMLAAEMSGTTVLSLRIDASPVPSAAMTRWGVAACPAAPLAAGAPGGAAFAVELLRRRGGPAGRRWNVEWNRDAYIFAQTPLPGAGLPLAAGGTAQDHAAASVRRAR